MLGVGLARRLQDVGLGQTMTVGRNTWHIVGLFEAGGSSLESELWMDGDLLQSSFHRDGVFQSVLFRADGSPREAAEQLNALTETDLRLRAMQAMTEKEYYQKQAKLMADVITILGGMLTAIMSAGAIAGAMNTMYAAVSQRRREIGCLLSMGFTPESVWLAFMIESLPARRARGGSRLHGVARLPRHEDRHDELGDVLRNGVRVPRHAADPRDRLADLAADGLRRRRDTGTARRADEGRGCPAASVIRLGRCLVRHKRGARTRPIETCCSGCWRCTRLYRSRAINCRDARWCSTKPRPWTMLLAGRKPLLDYGAVGDAGQGAFEAAWR